MTKEKLIKITNRCILSIFVLTLFQSCSTNSEENINYDSEKLLIEQLQLDCNESYKKSESLYASIEEIKHDNSNESLALLASKQLDIVDTLDLFFREIITLSESLKWQLMSVNHDLSSINSGKPIILPSDKFYPLRPSIVDINSYEFYAIESRPTSFNTSINDLKEIIEILREAIIESVLYGKSNSELQNLNTKNNYKNYSEEFNSKELASVKSREYACGLGELRRIQQIDLELILGDNYWNSAFSNSASSPVLFSHLINLQSNILNVRNMILELITLNLQCENMKMKN